MQAHARRWILVAVVYFCVAVSLGCYMGATMQFTFAPVHAHLNLLGWVTMTLTGLIYHHFPAAGSNRLAQVHFLGYNLVLPVQMASLAILLAGNPGIDPLLGISSVLMASLIVLFAVNVWRNSGADTVSATARPGAATGGAPAA